MKKVINAIKAIMFLLIFLIILNRVNRIMQPKWDDQWINSTTINDFYKLKGNSIDVLILGQSQTIRAISPLDLYGENGIGAYSISTETQPTFATYYWLKEADKYHDINLVVLEIIGFFRKSDEAFYRKAIDNMKFSPLKVEAALSRDYYTDIDTTSYIFPLYNYHLRWKELKEVDFSEKYKTLGYRGFYIASDFKETDYNGLTVTNSEEKAVLTEENLFYLNKIIEYCKENNIELLLIKTPNILWNEIQYNAANNIAKDNKLAYIDYNLPEQLEKTSFSFRTDMADDVHQNIYGAKKLSKDLAFYIKENYVVKNYVGKDKSLATEYEEYVKVLNDVLDN